ncbi:MAG: hypothetical protein FWE23_11455 [Chitinivibrionia bacterium]|nr:hypothetical protein [Chitinivibrionia bacterium]
MNFKKFLVLAVMLAALVFIGCSGGGTSGGGGYGGDETVSGVLELNLRGQVWLGDWTHDDIYDVLTDVRYTQFSGNRTVFSSIGVNGEISNGQLNFTVGTPSNIYLGYAYDYFDDWSGGYDNLRISNPEARVVLLWLNIPMSGVYRELETVSRSGNRTNYTGQHVIFIYVDQNLTVSGRGTSYNWQELWNGITYRETLRTSNFNISLKKGWNSILFRFEETVSISNNTIIYDLMETISIGNPNNLRWVLEGWDNYNEFSAETCSIRSNKNRQIERRSALINRMRTELSAE